jgi:hypothetical protein
MKDRGNHLTTNFTEYQCNEDAEAVLRAMGVMYTTLDGAR